MLTWWPAPMSPARAAASAHWRSREGEQVVGRRVLDVDAHPAPFRRAPAPVNLRRDAAHPVPRPTLRGARQAGRAAGASRAARRAERRGLLSRAVPPRATGRGSRTGWTRIRRAASSSRCVARRCWRRRPSLPPGGRARPTGRWCAAARRGTRGRSRTGCARSPRRPAGAWWRTRRARPRRPIGGCSAGRERSRGWS